MNVEQWWDSQTKKQRFDALRGLDFTVNLATSFAMQDWIGLPWWVQRLVENDYKPTGEPKRNEQYDARR